MRNKVQLELDHIFILVEPLGKVADLLIELGLTESFSRDHAGQGTTNRRFVFSNGMLEFLWIRDEFEAKNGPGQKLNLTERSADSSACPFGIIINAIEKNTDSLPFPGWEYQPDYFEKPMAFHVGENSNNLQEPLCIYPPYLKAPKRTKEAGKFKYISSAIIHTPTQHLSNVCKVANGAERIGFQLSNQHLLELTLDDHQQGKSKNFLPDIPLVLHW